MKYILLMVISGTISVARISLGFVFAIAACGDAASPNIADGGTTDPEFALNWLAHVVADEVDDRFGRQRFERPIFPGQLVAFGDENTMVTGTYFADMRIVDAQEQVRRLEMLGYEGFRALFSSSGELISLSDHNPIRGIRRLSDGNVLTTYVYEGSWCTTDSHDHDDCNDSYSVRLETAEGTKIWSTYEGIHAFTATSMAGFRDGSALVIGVFQSDLKGQLPRFGKDPEWVTPSVVPEILGGLDVFLARYNTEGNFLWVRTLGSTYDDAAPTGTIPLDDGSVVVYGQIDSSLTLSPGQPDSVTLENVDLYATYIARLDSQGALRWARIVPGQHGQLTQMTNERMAIGVMSPDGHLLTGELDQDGDFEWQDESPLQLQGRITAMDHMTDGSLVVAATLAGPFSNNNQELTESTGRQDTLLLHVNTAGELLRWIQLTGEADVFPSSVLVTTSDDIVVLGYFDGYADFGGQELTSDGRDFFVARYNVE